MFVFNPLIIKEKRRERERERKEKPNKSEKKRERERDWSTVKRNRLRPFFSSFVFQSNPCPHCSIAGGTGGRNKISPREQGRGKGSVFVFDRDR